MNLDWANEFEKALISESETKDYLFNNPSHLEFFVANKIDLGYSVRLGADNYGISHGTVVADVKHKYNINSFGYRSSEFDNQPLVFAGCSQTFGVGVPEEMIWGNQLANKLNEKCINISTPGASVQWIVQRLFSYFANYEKPKYLFCLFPDFYRMLVATNKNLLLSHSNDQKLPHIPIVQQAHLKNAEPIEDRPKYSKKPHVFSDVLPLELPFFLSCQHIHMLEQYCKSNNIKLIWSSWDFSTNRVIGHFKEKFNIFNNYIPIDSNSWSEVNEQHFLFENSEAAEMFNGKNTIKNCHKELEKKYSYCFSVGADLEMGRPHMGVHRHTHIAENFYEKVKGLNDTLGI